MRHPNSAYKIIIKPVSEQSRQPEPTERCINTEIAENLNSPKLTNITKQDRGVKMKYWYKSLTKGQKNFVYLVSAGLIFAWGVGLLPLAVLIYLELGERG